MSQFSGRTVSKRANVLANVLRPIRRANAVIESAVGRRCSNYDCITSIINDSIDSPPPVMLMYVSGLICIPLSPPPPLLLFHKSNFNADSIKSQRLETTQLAMRWEWRGWVGGRGLSISRDQSGWRPGGSSGWPPSNHSSLPVQRFQLLIISPG